MEYRMLSDMKPLALVVEDKEEIREARVEMLEQAGFHVIGASSKRDAEREIRACPSIDILVTDVNLNDKIDTEKSGIDLAGNMRKLRPNLPIIGYSAKFEGLPGIEDKVFNEVYLKGSFTPETLREQARQFYDRAIVYRQGRAEQAAEDSRRLQERYEIDPYDFSLLREFTPGLSLPDDTGGKSIESVLRDAGYKLEIIEKENVPYDAVSEGIVVEYPIPIWLRLGHNHVVAEVYRFPELYAGGETEGDSITQLLLLMAGYHQDLLDDDETSMGQRVHDLRDYLNHVFGH